MWALPTSESGSAVSLAMAFAQEASRARPRPALRPALRPSPGALILFKIL